MKICINGITRDMTSEEIAAWQRSCMGLPPTATDAELAAAIVARDRAAKLAAIDARTAAGISAGYTYAGKVFSASANHQTWALGLKDDIINDGLDATGTPVPSKDNDESHIIESNDDALALVAACKAHVRYWLASGSALKKAAQKAADPSAIMDPR